MFGQVGILPALGLLGSSLSAGGTYGLGFTMMSGLLNTMIRPKDAMPAFGGLVQPTAFGPFGSLEGGPNVASVGALAGYIGQQYAAMGLPVPSPTLSGQYFGNAGYNFGTAGVSYAPGVAAPGDFRGAVSQLQFGGDLGAYQQSFANMNTIFPESGSPQSYSTFGNAMAPFGQSIAPMLTPYSAGYPMQYNPAATLMGYQNGSISTFNQTPPPNYLGNNSGPSRAQAIVGDNSSSSSSEEGSDLSASGAGLG